MSRRSVAALFFVAGFLTAGTAAAREQDSAAEPPEGLIAVSTASAYGVYVVDPNMPSPKRRLLAERGSWPAWTADGRRIGYLKNHANGRTASVRRR